MKGMMRSFRFRLSVWIASVLALLLAIFGLVLCFSLQGWLQNSIDSELQFRAQRFAGGPPPPRRPGLAGILTPDRPRPGIPPFIRTWPGPNSNPLAGQPPPTDQQHPTDQPPLGDQPPPGAHQSPADQPPPDGQPPPADGSPPGPPGEPPAARSSLPAVTSSTSDPDMNRLARSHAPHFILRGAPPRPADDPQSPWDPATVPQAMTGLDQFSTITRDGQHLRVYSTPWLNHGHVLGVVQVATDLADADVLWAGQLRTLAMVLPLSLFAAIACGLFLTNRALRPVQQVTEAAAQIGVEDLSRRLEVTGKDELADLAATFNGMIGRLESAFEQQRRFTADASHELRTPLARIKVSTSMALQGVQSEEDYRASLKVADTAADAMGRLVDQLLLLARADAHQLRLNLQTLDLSNVARDAAKAFPDTGGVKLSLNLPPDPALVVADEDQLGRVFLNLIENALRYTPAGGQITLSVRQADTTVVAAVADTGEGIPPEHLPHITERFYRVEEARSRRGGGAGLGLAITKSIVEAHGGSLSIQSEPGRGTTATVTLPRSTASDSLTGTTAPVTAIQR